MEKQLLLFNGGLNTKVSPHLAQENQAVECSNIDLTKGSIYPIKDFEIRASFTPTGYSNTFFNKQLVSSDIDEVRSYAIFGSRLYFTNGDYGSYGLYRVKDGNVVDATPPDVTTYYGFSHTFQTNGNLSGDYAYVYTVVDDEGVESAPSAIHYVKNVANQNIVLSATGSEVIASGETVAFRRLYRTGGVNPTFNLIGEFAPTETNFTDSISDLDVSRIELTTFERSTPPTDLIHLAQCSGTMFASKGNKVYFSANGLPESWSELDYVVLDDTCTGIGIYTNQVIAFTESSSYQIVGTTRDNIYINKLPYKEGCLNHKTISNVTGMLVWTSKNGVCIYNGSNVTNVTKNILEWSGDGRLGSITFDSNESSFDSNIGYLVKSAVGLDDKYYAVFQNGLGVIDISNGLVASIIEYEDLEDVIYDNDENSITVVDKDLNLMVFKANENNMTARWKTGLISNGDYSILKDYRKIEFDNAPSSVKVYIDDKLVLTMLRTKVFHLPANSIGRSIQLYIEANTEIRSVYIQYGIVG